jgi:hypothetical protein
VTTHDEIATLRAALENAEKARQQGWNEANQLKRAVKERDELLQKWLALPGPGKVTKRYLDARRPLVEATRTLLGLTKKKGKES